MLRTEMLRNGFLAMHSCFPFFLTPEKQTKHLAEKP